MLWWFFVNEYLLFSISAASLYASWFLMRKVPLVFILHYGVERAKFLFDEATANIVFWFHIMIAQLEDLLFHRLAYVSSCVNLSIWDEDLLGHSITLWANERCASIKEGPDDESVLQRVKRRPLVGHLPIKLLEGWSTFFHYPIQWYWFRSRYCFPFSYCQRGTTIRNQHQKDFVNLVLVLPFCSR